MRRSWVLVIGLSLLALPAFAGGAVQSGTDLWVTPADGTTFSDFSYNPIPAGFFCARSVAFTGKVAFKGAPLASDSPAVMRNSDTVIERLDTAEFDDAGRAVTRLRARALNLASIAPVKTACGDFDVRASLAGDQPVTRMRIFRDGDSGGRFLAPLALNVKLTFTPAGRTGGALELLQQVRFPADPRSSWMAENNKAATVRYIRIDTDGDGRPDTLVPGPSNFRAGVRPSMAKFRYEEVEPIGVDPYEGIDPIYTTPSYHTSPPHAHTTYPPPPCDNSPLRRALEEVSPIDC
jgi:hypothetical protein